MGNLWIFPLSFTVNLKLLKKKKVYLTFETNIKQFPNGMKTKIPMIPKFHWFPKWKNIKKTITMYTLIKLPKTNGINNSIFFKKTSVTLSLDVSQRSEQRLTLTHDKAHLILENKVGNVSLPLREWWIKKRNYRLIKRFFKNEKLCFTMK